MESLEMPRSVPLSVRITDDDAAFLAEYRAEGARTPSEKLRAILADARRLQANSDDYAGNAEMITGLLKPAQSRLRTTQHRQKLRSDFVSRLYDRLPELTASLMVGLPSADSDITDMRAYEADLAHQVFGLIEETLDLGLTQSTRTYDPDLISTRLDPILETLDLIRHSRTSKGETNHE
jgi:hypothetical protein